MKEINIPHAQTAFIDCKSQVPREILVVKTLLPQHSSAGPEADGRYELLNAVARAKADHGLHGDDIHWGDDASRS